MKNYKLKKNTLNNLKIIIEKKQETKKKKKLQRSSV